MLNMKKLISIKERINLKKVCEHAGLSYDSINQKVWRYENGNKKIEFSVREAQLLTKQIKDIYNITMEDD